MKTKKKQPTTPQPKQRNNYTLETKATAKRYYMIGLTLQEIGKLIDAPPRTVEKWKIAENWKAQKNISLIEVRAYELQKQGRSYLEISEILKVSIPTVSRYISKAKKMNQ